MNTLKTHIMRRIYYAYAIRMLVNRYTFHAVLAALSMFLLFRLVSVSSVFANLLQVKVSQVPSFIFNAFKNTDLVTIVVVAVLFSVFVSFTRGIFGMRGQGGLQVAYH